MVARVCGPSWLVLVDPAGQPIDRHVIAAEELLPLLLPGAVVGGGGHPQRR
jgi:hypothetical protein